MNPNDPAFPIVLQDYGDGVTSIPIATGLTIRAHFALELLKGILSNDDMPPDGINGDVKCALAYADDLIIELNKTEP